jgi:hypothetical protein
MSVSFDRLKYVSPHIPISHSRTPRITFFKHIQHGAASRMKQDSNLLFLELYEFNSTHVALFSNGADLVFSLPITFISKDLYEF